MKKFISRILVFFSVPAFCAAAWIAFVVATDRASYYGSLEAPRGARVLVCSDSQTKDALDPSLFPELFNFSNAASSPDQNLLRLKDVLERNPGRFKYVIVDASPLKLEYDPCKPLSEASASRVHFLIHLYHAGENIRPVGSYASLVRDVLFTRKFNEFRKSVLRRKNWRSSLAGGFDPDKTSGFVDKKYRKKAMEDVAAKADRINRVPRIDASAPYFYVLAEEIAAVRAAGAVPVLATMPLSRPLREACSPEQLTAFSRAVKRVAALLGVERLDYLEYDIPDVCWHDANHLNRGGAAAFTPVIAADFGKLVARLESRPGKRLVKAGEADRSAMPSDLSGLARDPSGGYWAVCDSRGELCRLDIQIDSATGSVNGCRLVSKCRVPGADDMEGLAWDPLRNSLWISDESGPRVFEYAPDEGLAGGELAIPGNLMMPEANRAFESVEISPDGLSLWICTENELPADQALSPGMSELLRLTRFVRSDARDVWRLDGQWLYRPEHANRFDSAGLVRNGVASLCIAPDGSLFVMEREKDARSGVRYRTRVFEADFVSATDMLADGSAEFPVPLGKTPLFDEYTGDSMYEGMCPGPALDDGSQSFVLVSDGDGPASEKVMSLVLR